MFFENVYKTKRLICFVLFKRRFSKTTVCLKSFVWTVFSFEYFFKLLMFFFVIFFYFRSTTFTEVIFTQSNFLSEEWQNCIHSAWHIWKISFKTVAKGEYPKRSPYIVGVHWLSVATIKKTSLSLRYQNQIIICTTFQKIVKF